VRNQVGNAALAKLDALDLAKLVLCLLSGDAVDGETALGVVDQAEVLASLLDGDDVHETGGEGAVGADLAVDLDQALLDDGLDLVTVKRILEAVAEEDDQGQRVAGLVGTSGGLGSVGTWEVLVLLSHCLSEVRICESASASCGGAIAVSCVPDSLSKSQCLGALRRFWCFLGPRAILSVL
jgi:hypothetical protein